MKTKRANRSVRTAGLALLAGVTLIVASGCSTGAAAPSGSTPANTTVRVVTSVSNSFPYIVLQAADKLGTWKDSGIKVELIAGTSPTTGQIMAGNQADVVIDSGISIASNINAGLPATLVAGNDLYWDTRIIGRKASGITSVAQLKGKNFGITGKGGPGDYTVRKMAQSLGWSESDFKETTLKDLPALTAALTSGAIDAFPWGSDVGYKMEAAGTGIILADTADFVGPSVFHGFAVNNAFLKSNAGLLKKFFTTYFAMAKKIQTQPELLNNILVNDWKVPEAAAKLIVKNSVSKISLDGVIKKEELTGLAEAVAFNVNDPSLKSKPIKYTYWKDLK